MTATQIALGDIDLLAIGNEIDIYGVIYSGQGRVFMLPLPGENPDDLDGNVSILKMNESELERFFQQTDFLNVEGPNKIILRKSQRVVDQTISWKVYKRDGYRCRYCYGEKPLTVDHIDLWEDGGVTIESNLLAACRRCNKLRGRMPYTDWLQSAEYARVSMDLPAEVKARNQYVIPTIPGLVAKRTAKQRSR
jgi:hypothetical protein